ncbi:MAG: hypothetical protein Q9157_007599 [Trypethelium eluteriae]
MATFDSQTDSEIEKGPVPAEVDEIYVEGHGDMQVLKASEAGNLKLAKDGVTILIPQPSDDPDDPLNWSWTQKHLALIPLIFASLLTDFSITWGSVLFQAQGPTFNMTPSAVSQSLSGSLFMMGPGGVLAVPLIQRFGRLPVVFWSQILAALTVMAAAVSPNYACFTAFRTLQGFVCSPPQVVGLRVLSGLFGFSAILVVLLGRETLYDRLSPQKKEAGVKAVIFIMVLVAWVIGINTTISLLVVPPPYSFSPSAEAVSWVAPMIGAGLGELWGYWFNDFLLRRHLRTHEGSYTVENRLWGVYTPAVIAFVGLILYGQALQHTLHWIALLVAWACVAFVAGANVTINKRLAKLRTNGQTVDIRIVGVFIMRKISGMEAAARAKTTQIEGYSFIGDSSQSYGIIKATARRSPDQQSLISEYEIFRGDLAQILLDLTNDNEKIKYAFGEQVT